MSFFAGGFIFNPKRNEVLLHLRDNKTKDNPNQWAFFGGTSLGKEKPIETFQRELREETGIRTDENSIKSLCDYFNPDFNTHRYVFYLAQDDFAVKNLTEGKKTQWFSLDNVFDENLSKRTHQDLSYFISLLKL